MHASDELATAGTAQEPVQIQWLNPAGEHMSAAQWGESFARCVGLLLTDKKTWRMLLMIFNASRESIEYSVPLASEDEHWSCKLNTAETLASDAVPTGLLADVDMNNTITVAASSVLVFASNPKDVVRN